MGSNAGISDGVFDRLEIIQDLGVGQDQDFGTNGQVLISGGENEGLRWGSNSATLPNKLNKSGSNIVMTKTSDGSVVSFFDGSIETNIASTNTIYLADKGVEINTATSPDTLEANVDGTTINNTGGGGSDELNVLKVPNTITFVNDGSGATTGTFDGSSAITIEVGDTAHSFQATKGVEIDTTTSPETIQAKVDDTTINNTGGGGSDELNVLKVPNTITFVNDGSGATTGTFDGSSAITIEVGDTAHSFQATKGVEIDTSTSPETIQAKVDDTNAGSQTIQNDYNNDELHVLRVPNNLTTNLGVEYQSSLTSYDGSVQTTIVAKIDKNSKQTMSNNGGTGNNELNVLKTPFNLVADSPTDTITIGGSTTGVFNGGLSNKVISVAKVPNTLTIIDGATTIVYDGSAPISLTIVQGSTDHTQVSRQGQSASATIFSSTFSTITPGLTTGAFTPITGWGIESLTAVSTSYKIDLSFLLFSPGSTTTSSGTFCRGYLRLDKSVATTTTSAWGSGGDNSGVFAPIFLGGVKIVGGIFNFGGFVLGAAGESYFDGRVHYTFIVSALTIGSSYNFIPKFVSHNNTSNTKAACAVGYGGVYGFATCSAVPIGINSPVLNVESSEDDY